MNTWIYEIPDGYVMIDTGYPGKLKSVEKRMKRHGIRWSDIRCLFLSKCMSLWGKGKHLFPPLSDAFGDRIMWITEETRDALETRIGGKILFTPGHTGDSVSLKVGRVIFPGDAAMNGFPSSRRITIWVENPAAFGRSWDLLIAEDADMLYPAHGKPFAKEELVRFRPAVDRIRLYALE